MNIILDLCKIATWPGTRENQHRTSIIGGIDGPGTFRWRLPDWPFLISISECNWDCYAPCRYIHAGPLSSYSDVVVVTRLSTMHLSCFIIHLKKFCLERLSCCLFWFAWIKIFSHDNHKKSHAKVSHTR